MIIVLSSTSKYKDEWSPKLVSRVSSTPKYKDEWSPDLNIKMNGVMNPYLVVSFPK